MEDLTDDHSEKSQTLEFIIFHFARLARGHMIGFRFHYLFR